MRVKRLVFLAVSAILVIVCSLVGQEQKGTTTALQSPPVAPVRPVIEDYHGTKVSDPYRYLENVKDPAVQSWFKGQNDYTRALLAAIPGRSGLLARIEELDRSVPKVFVGRLPENLFLLEKLLPGENVFKLYKRRGISGEDTLLLDPEKVGLSGSSQSKGKNTVSGVSVSDDSRYAAVGIIPGGSELDGELRVIETATGRETGDVITQVGAEAWEPHWLPDNRSFVYGHLQKLLPGAPEAEVRQKFRSYLHVLGTDPANDLPVFGYGVVPSIEVDPSLIASVQTQPGSQYALGVLNGSVTPNSAYYIASAKAVGTPNPGWRKVADFADGVTSIGLHGDEMYLLTYKNASRYKILRTDARDPNLATAEAVVPPSESVITGIYPAGDALYVALLDGGIGRVLRLPYGPHPVSEEVALPVKGSVYVGADPRIPGALLYLTTWTKAFTVYAYEPQTKKVTDTKLQPRGPYDEPANIESVEVKAGSYDGVSIPLSLVYSKGTNLNGKNPTLLDGYGGYGISMSPYFDPTQLAWFEKGAIYAVCHVRGGGEYGEEWHLAGKGATKPNTWRDFIACAQYLIDHKYTSPAHLAGMGTSAGGIMIGRAITERPDLFGAAIDKVGVSDTLRFETTQNGQTNIPELGSTKTEHGFKALYAMSSYEHIEDKTPYPAVLFETGMNDPRVSPWEMGKMTARLQAATSGQKPILLRVDFAGGHGDMGGTEEQRHETQADEWSFLLWQLGLPEFQPKK